MEEKEGEDKTRKALSVQAPVGVLQKKGEAVQVPATQALAVVWEKKKETDDAEKNQ